MIVLSRKKILSVIGVMSLLIVTVTFFDILDSKPKTVETVNLPVSNKVIVLDAGHGIPDERCGK